MNRRDLLKMAGATGLTALTPKEAKKVEVKEAEKTQIYTRGLPDHIVYTTAMPFSATPAFKLDEE